MRVTNPLTFRSDDDRGSVMIIFASIVLACVGLLALVTDVGASRNARARLLTGTDSAAIAAAREHAEGGNGCNADENDDGVVSSGEKSLAEERLHANSSNAVLDFCGLQSVASGNQVLTVSAHEQVSYLLGPVVGDDSGISYASTSVRFGAPTQATGLRPIGICFDHPSLVAWADSGYPSPSADYRIYFTENVGTEGCGDPSGNWGPLDFDGGDNSSSDLSDWFSGGFDGVISVGQEIEGDPGAPSTGSGASAMANDIVNFPVIMYASASGGGANTDFIVVGFVRGLVTSVKTTGASNTRYFDIRFYTGAGEGSCCAPTGLPGGGFFGLGIYEICGTDNDTTDC